jgi:hypothetical protein
MKITNKHILSKYMQLWGPYPGRMEPFIDYCLTEWIVYFDCKHFKKVRHKTNIDNFCQQCATVRAIVRWEFSGAENYDPTDKKNWLHVVEWDPAKKIGAKLPMVKRIPKEGDPKKVGVPIAMVDWNCIEDSVTIRQAEDLPQLQEWEEIKRYYPQTFPSVEFHEPKALTVFKIPKHELERTVIVAEIRKLRLINDVQFYIIQPEPDNMEQEISNPRLRRLTANI